LAILTIQADKRSRRGAYRTTNRGGSSCQSSPRQRPSYKRAVTPDDESGRSFGKTYDLAFGFGGGVGAWRKFDPSDTYSDTEIERFKNAFRRSHRATVKFWHALERSVHRCVRTGAPSNLGNRFSFTMENGTLFMTLPSGRRLAYPEACLMPGKFEFTRELRYKDNARGGWTNIGAWYGTLVENAVQATARDLLAAAMLRLEAAGYLSKTRGIDLAALPANINAVLRFHARCPFGPGTRHPCLLALLRDAATDAIAGIQRIALTPDAHKIERRMLGRTGAAKLWPVRDQLVVGEGIETVLAAATRIPYRGAALQPAWSMISSYALGRLPVIPGVERLIILVDHDEAGLTASGTCMDRWIRAGRSVVRLKPKRAGADFNDLVMESAA
jgi:hypothetical protein